MKNRFALGDVVRLRSGGSEMTIAALTTTLAVCNWSDAQRQSRSEFFSLDLLELLSSTAAQRPLKAKRPPARRVA